MSLRGTIKYYRIHVTERHDQCTLISRDVIVVLLSGDITMTGSDCNSVSEKVAEYIDSHLKLKTSQHHSYIKKITYDLIDKIKDILIPHSLRITLDVESMYTNILHENGLESITEIFKYSYLDENVFELLEVCLKIEFDGKWFLQNSGTTIRAQSGLHIMQISIWHILKKKR